MARRRSTARAGRGRRCVLCEREFGVHQMAGVQPLEHFEDRCFCPECLRKERAGGWREPSVRLK